jgi:hypothetical protein
MSDKRCIKVLIMNHFQRAWLKRLINAAIITAMLSSLTTRYSITTEQTVGEMIEPNRTAIASLLSAFPLDSQ